MYLQFPNDFNNAAIFFVFNATAQRMIEEI